MAVHVNCDWAEGATDDPALLDLLDQVNLALGGHAGSAALAREWNQRAVDAGVTVCLHPGYADAAGFGRRSGFQQGVDLLESLRVQRAVLPDCDLCKFHGALYTDADEDAQLAASLTDWCIAEGIHGLVVPPAGELEAAARAAGLAVLREGFVDRRYRILADRAVLVPRSDADAVHVDVSAMVAQVREVVTGGMLSTRDGLLPFSCETWCVHGDDPRAPVVLQALREACA